VESPGRVKDDTKIPTLEVLLNRGGDPGKREPMVPVSAKGRRRMRQLKRYQLRGRGRGVESKDPGTWETDDLKERVKQNHRP